MLITKENSSLTPENARKKGFEFVSDIIFDTEAPEPVNRQTISLLKKGYRLGQPASRGASDIFVGLYKPLSFKSSSKDKP